MGILANEASQEAMTFRGRFGPLSSRCTHVKGTFSRVLAAGIVYILMDSQSASCSSSAFQTLHSFWQLPSAPPTKAGVEKHLPPGVSAPLKSKHPSEFFADRNGVCQSLIPPHFSPPTSRHQILSLPNQKCPHICVHVHKGCPSSDPNP